MLQGFCYRCPHPCQLYPVNFTLTHWFINILASGSNDAANTFVLADIKSVKILVDALPLKLLKKQRTAREGPVLKRDPRREIFEAQMVGKV